MQLHLNQMDRRRLVGLLWEKTTGRYRRAMERGRVEIVGVFRCHRTGNQYLAARVKARRSLWLRVYEIRRPGGRYEILALPAQPPDWLDWQEELYEGDNVRAYRRCRALAQRRRRAGPPPRKEIGHDGASRVSTAGSVGGRVLEADG